MKRLNQRKNQEWPIENEWKLTLSTMSFVIHQKGFFIFPIRTYRKIVNKIERDGGHRQVCSMHFYLSLARPLLAVASWPPADPVHLFIFPSFATSYTTTSLLLLLVCFSTVMPAKKSSSSPRICPQWVGDRYLTTSFFAVKVFKMWKNCWNLTRGGNGKIFFSSSCV